MKKVKDDMRPEYKRSDFTYLERGKFYSEVAKGSVVVLLSPQNAKAFPTSQAVNDALAGLLALNGNKRTSGRSRRAAQTRAPRRVRDRP
jgi:hypothetical protein